MSNVVVGYPIYSDVGPLYTPTLTGGSWEAALPLTNLQDRRLARVARSADALAASTTFDINLGAARPVFCLALPTHNASTAATIRVRGSSVSGSYAGGDLVYDTTTLAVIASGMTAEDMNGINVGWTHVPSAAQTARYWRFEITDTGNADGYIELGRVVVAGGWQPTYNMNYGARLGLDTDTTRSLTDGGAAVYTSRPVRRTLTFAISDLGEDEALANGFDLQRLAGTAGQMMVVYDPADTTHMYRRAFLATLQSLSPLEAAPLARYGVPLSFVEEL
jgi:hypothetical protein